MVLMKRTSTEGSLVYGDKTGIPAGIDKTDDILPDKKKDSFVLSIQNQTIPKEKIIENCLKEDFDKKFYKALVSFIKSVLKGDTGIETCKEFTGVTEEKINSYLNHRFRDKEFKYSYYNETEEKIGSSFNLAKLIVEYIGSRDIGRMSPYKSWAEWYIRDKSKKLKKSVKNNRIVIDNPEPANEKEDKLAPRKRALQEWEGEFIENGSLNLDNMHSQYGTCRLAEALKKTEYTLNERRVGDMNKYHRDLKRTLQKHQREIFGSSSNRQNRDNVQLYTYNLEVVKYLEHYFPIKKSKRKTTQDTVKYYLDADRLKETVRKQLENAVRANLLRQGKFAFHNDMCLADGIDSRSLSEQKADEAFVLNLISNCAFAANNIRNIVDPEQTIDILMCKALQKSLAKKSVNKNLFKFFYGFDVKDIDITDEAFWAMQRAVTGIRHNVVHYKAKALDKINNILGENKEYKDTLFKTQLKNELENAGSAFAERLKTGGVLTYFPEDKLNEFLKKNEFELYHSAVPFAPGFKKVMRRGINYQNANRDETFYDLELSIYTDKEDSRDESWKARYFLLKTIYNNLFLPQFTNDKQKFKKAANYVLKKNKEQAGQSKNRHAYAFNDIEKYIEEDIASYMAYIQSHTMMEKNKKEDTDKEENINFEKFVLQVFIKGFDSFMTSSPSLDFVRVPWTEQIEGSEQEKAEQLNCKEKEIIKNIKLKRTEINPENNVHIAFYIFCKLLNTSYLTTLRNEIIKYRSARNTGEWKYKHLLEIIELCMLSADVVPGDYKLLYETKETCLERISPYIKPEENYQEWDALYVQSDGNTPVMHAPVELAVKYGTSGLLKQVISRDERFWLQKKNFDKWIEMKEPIDSFIDKRNSLHSKWEKVKETEDKKHFVESYGQEYIDNCKAINNYNWLDNKLHFVHLKNLHNLTIDILGRLAGFTALFERDFQYICQNKKMNKQVNGLDGLNFLNGLPHPDKLKEKEEYLKKIFLSDDYRDLRNFIAHFNFLTEIAETEDSKKKYYSIIEMINGLRELFRYDRKLKNAVSKAIIDLFDKHGMILKLKFNMQHRLTVESITPKQLIHFGGRHKLNGKAITTNQVQPVYCDMCKTLLELKK